LRAPSTLGGTSKHSPCFSFTVVKRVEGDQTPRRQSGDFRRSQNSTSKLDAAAGTSEERNYGHAFCAARCASDGCIPTRRCCVEACRRELECTRAHCGPHHVGTQRGARATGEFFLMKLLAVHGRGRTYMQQLPSSVAVTKATSPKLSADRRAITRAPSRARVSFLVTSLTNNRQLESNDCWLPGMLPIACWISHERQRGMQGLHTCPHASELPLRHWWAVLGWLFADSRWAREILALVERSWCSSLCKH
jgi:hypothetical protein